LKERNKAVIVETHVQLFVKSKQTIAETDLTTEKSVASAKKTICKISQKPGIIMNYTWMRCVIENYHFSASKSGIEKRRNSYIKLVNKVDAMTIT